MTDTVEMTKRNGAAWALANVPADAVAIWESDGWKAEKPKAVKSVRSTDSK